MASGDDYRLSFDQVVHGVLCTNVLYYEQFNNVDPGFSDESQLIIAFLEDVVPLYQAALSTGWLGACIKVQRVQPDTGGVVVATLAAANGLRTGEPIPANKCAMAQLRSPDVGLDAQGRCFISGWSEDDILHGNLESDNILNIQALATALVTTIAPAADGGSWIPGHASSVDLVFHQYDTGYINPKVRTVKNRTETLCYTA